MDVFLLFIGAILAIIGVIFIYDARIVSEKYFSMSDTNSAIAGLKVIGFVLLLVSWILLFNNYIV